MNSTKQIINFNLKKLRKSLTFFTISREKYYFNNKYQKKRQHVAPNFYKRENVNIISKGGKQKHQIFKNKTKIN